MRADRVEPWLSAPTHARQQDQKSIQYRVSQGLCKLAGSIGSSRIVVSARMAEVCVREVPSARLTRRGHTDMLTSGSVADAPGACMGWRRIGKGRRSTGLHAVGTVGKRGRLSAIRRGWITLVELNPRQDDFNAIHRSRKQPQHVVGWG